MSETDKLILDFLKKFSSFENALRITGSVGINENATINWPEIKSRLQDNKFKFTDEQKKLEIIKHPPKKLKFNKENKVLVWELGNIDLTDHSLAVDVLIRVRNNLYHGSKKFGDSSESERNVSLIYSALVILDDVVKSLGIDDVYEDIVDYWN